MLLTFLRSLLRPAAPGAAHEYPVERQERIKQAHARAPLDAHLEILYRDLRIGEHGVADLVSRALARSDARVPPLKALHRPLASYFLARYFVHALRIDGLQAECGVFQGTSALILCRAARTARAEYNGGCLHLIDSFAGLSEPRTEDRFALPGRAGATQRSAAARGGMLAGSLATARAALAEFPGVSFHQGWIPEPFAHLPEARWSFVHIDVDLYEPTYASLEYFHPRLAPGGVIVCDDYGSASFPGAYRAWNRFCDERGTPFVVLDTGQSVILNAV